MVLNEPMLTTQYLASILKVTQTTIRSWIATGELRAMRVGREYRLAIADVEAFLEANATRPRADARPVAGPGMEKPRPARGMTMRKSFPPQGSAR